jgi:hypothetical protein
MSMNSLNRIGLRAALTVLLAFIFAGCSQTSSENVTTQGIFADIRVIAEGNGATVVKVQLLVGNGGIGRTQLILAPGDTLTVTANGIQKTMVRDTSLIGEVEYWASYGFDDADTLFTVALNRANGMSAPNSNVTLPDGFVVMLPVSSTVFRTGEVIDVVWAPSGTATVPSISITVDCVLTTGIFISESRNLSPSTDSGASSIAVDSVIPSGPIDTNQQCEGTVYLSRQRYGNLDPNYGEGGLISAEHHNRGTFFVDPKP